MKVISDMTTETTIEKMREFFATFGLPSVLVTDRGTQFTSDSFQKFLKKNGIVHKMGAPYHPATNGQAERYVQTFKDKIKALKCPRSDVHVELQKILMAYRRTVHPSTGKSPSMLVFGRQIKSRIDLMIPKVDSQNSCRGEEKTVRSFTVHDRVAARDFLSSSEKWRFGVVAKKIGKLHYMIELDDGRMWKRHIDQLKPGPIIQQTQPELQVQSSTSRREVITPSSAGLNAVQPKIELDSTDPTLDISVDVDADIDTTEHTQQSTPDSTAVRDTEAGSGSNIKRSVKSKTTMKNACDTIRRSTRERRPPRRLNL